jgi:hypothetical protein
MTARFSLAIAAVVLAGVTAGCDWPVTSQAARYTFARSGGLQTVVYLVAPDTSGGLEAEIARVAAYMDARSDLRVVRSATDPGNAYNRVVIRRKAMNGAGVINVWPLDDPNRLTDQAAGLVRLKWLFFDNSKPWPSYQLWVVAHELAGHALCSLDHPASGPGPTIDGELTLWDNLLCTSRLATVRAGAPAGI